MKTAEKKCFEHTTLRKYPHGIIGKHLCSFSGLYPGKHGIIGKHLCSFSGLYPGKHGIIGKQFYDPDIPRGTNQGRGIFFDFRDQVTIQKVGAFYI